MLGTLETAKLGALETDDIWSIGDIGDTWSFGNRGDAWGFF